VQAGFTDINCSKIQDTIAISEFSCVINNKESLILGSCQISRLIVPVFYQRFSIYIIINSKDSNTFSRCCPDGDDWFIGSIEN